jgi:hypothetical protein
VEVAGGGGASDVGGQRWQARAAEGRMLAALEKEGIESGGDGEGRSRAFCGYGVRRVCVRLEGDVDG